MSGLFITLEGGEGAGKSTQLDHIRSWLAARGREVVVTREPGGTVLSELLRDLVLHGDHPEMSPHTELLLIFAARAQHIDEVIRPALERDAIVLCDRFTDASYAYQGGGRGLPVEHIGALEKVVHRGLQPDVTVLLDLPVQEGLRRARGRGSEDRFENESEAFLQRVRDAYLSRARAFPGRFTVIDASLERDAVWGQIRAVLERHVP